MKYEELEQTLLDNEISADSWVQGGRMLQMKSRSLVREDRAMYMRKTVARNDGEHRNTMMRRSFR